MQIPGYVSISAFAKEVNLPYMTVINQMKRGFCPWPQRKISGNTKHPLYKTWENILTRCTNPNATGYHNYGGRGIGICLRWRNSFNLFLEDMGNKPSPKHSIDRIDVNGNYEPSNCRWATFEEQRETTRKLLGCIVKEKTCNSWKVAWRDGSLVKRFKSEETAKQYLTKLRNEFYGEGNY